MMTVYNYRWRRVVTVDKVGCSISEGLYTVDDLTLAGWRGGSRILENLRV